MKRLKSIIKDFKIKGVISDNRYGLYSKEIPSIFITHQLEIQTPIFKNLIKNKGGFVSAHWDGTKETEEKIKKETKATIRCIPIEKVEEKGNCIYSKKPSEQRVLFAKAY